MLDIVNISKSITTLRVMQLKTKEKMRTSTCFHLFCVSIDLILQRDCCAVYIYVEVTGWTVWRRVHSVEFRRIDLSKQAQWMDDRLNPWLPTIAMLHKGNNAASVFAAESVRWVIIARTFKTDHAVGNRTLGEQQTSLCMKKPQQSFTRARCSCHGNSTHKFLVRRGDCKGSTLCYKQRSAPTQNVMNMTSPTWIFCPALSVTFSWVESSFTATTPLSTSSVVFW